MERETLTLTIHGLPAFNKDVDGEVFARKFFKFMQGLGEADYAANGKRRLKYLIEKLVKNTATAAVREQLASGGADVESGIAFYQRAAHAIYHDQPTARALPVELVKYIVDLTVGVGTTFERGVIKSGANDNILIDESLEKNARRVLNEIQRLSLGIVAPFSGEANISLDGRVTTLESRGEGDKAVIILSAGGKQIDCLVARIPEDKLRAIWKKRCTVIGTGHYSGNRTLPDYIDAVRIDQVPEDGDWTPWRGAFKGPLSEDEDWQ